MRHHLKAVAQPRTISCRRGLSGNATQTCSQVEMSGSKAAIKLIATLTFLSMGVVVCPQGVRSQAPYSTPTTTDTRYCAKPTKETEPPDCSFSNIKDCRTSLKAKGGGAVTSNSAAGVMVPAHWFKRTRPRRSIWPFRSNCKQVIEWQ